MKRILIIEDDRAIRRGLEDNLLYEGYVVDSAGSAEHGYGKITEHDPDLIVLDVMLPGTSGFDLCRRLRREGRDIPILMLTARGEEADRVMGLDLGADDYVTKPFSILEFLARVRALLRRSSDDAPLPDTVRIGAVVVDFKKFEARTGSGTLSLSPKEFGLLQVLASRPGEVFTRGELLDRVWGEDHFPNTRTVDNHISMLRAKVEPEPGAPIHIQTVHGVGYKLLPDA